MEVLEAIKSRRSIRKFKPDAGRLAPSGTNLQPTRYVIVKSEDTKKKTK